ANAQNFGDSSSTITNYSFDFGDHTTPVSGTSPTAGHTYAKPGAYTVTVTVTDATGATSTATHSYATQAGDFTPSGPTRLLDTRNGTGAPVGAVPSNGVVNLKIAGVGVIPGNATAVVVNLTALAATQSGYLEVYGHGDPAPGTSALNFGVGDVVPNLAVVKLGADGSIDLLNGSGGTVQLLADVTGYFTVAPTDGYTALSPDRLLDTRTGTGAPKAPVTAGHSVVLTVAGADGGKLPTSGIKAVALNVTVTGTVGAGFISAYPDGTTRPVTSNLNFTTGQTVPNMVIVPVGADGKVDLYNSASSVNLVADVTGYFSADGASAYFPLPAYRVADSRLGNGLATPIGAAQNEALAMADASAPSPLFQNMTAFVLNVTVTGPQAGGYLTVFPNGTTPPTASNLNFNPGQTIANMVLAAPGSDAGKSVGFHNGSGGTVNVIADLSGVFGTY
ncbi:MAG: PKD domain-containing protein, partial [Actinocrinis sp.]